MEKKVNFYSIDPEKWVPFPVIPFQEAIGKTIKTIYSEDGYLLYFYTDHTFSVIDTEQDFSFDGDIVNKDSFFRFVNWAITGASFLAALVKEEYITQADVFNYHQKRNEISLKFKQKTDVAQMKALMKLYPVDAHCIMEEIPIPTKDGN